MYATATYEILSSSEVFIEVNYPDGTFGMERVARPRLLTHLEAAYNAASVKATNHGYRLGHISLVKP